MSYSLLHRLYPPRVAGEPFEKCGVFPVGHKSMGERLLYQSDALEHLVGQASPELLKPSLRRVQLRRAGWKPEEADVLRKHYLLGAMAWRAVQDDKKVVIK